VEDKIYNLHQEGAMQAFKPLEEDETRRTQFMEYERGGKATLRSLASALNSEDTAGSLYPAADFIIASVDFEGHEGRGKRITRFGIAALDTRQLLAMPNASCSIECDNYVF
jgi:hypothetical protein